MRHNAASRASVSAGPYGLGMTVSPTFDMEVRAAIRVALRGSLNVVRLGADNDQVGWLWAPATGSAAASERQSLRCFPYVINELGADANAGTNLALSQSREMIADSAGSLTAIGELIAVDDPSVRRSSIGPLARACAEKAATAFRVMEGLDEGDRLRRALTVELAGLDRLLKLLPATRSGGRVGDVESARDEFVRIGKTTFSSCEKGSRGWTIDGHSMPSLTDRVQSVTSFTSYAELNVFTHPTGHVMTAHSRVTRAGQGQVATAPESSVHDEGRLCEPAVLAFARALEVAAAYMGKDARAELTDWAGSIAGLWSRWCGANGC